MWRAKLATQLATQTTSQFYNHFKVSGYLYHLKFSTELVDKNSTLKSPISSGKISITLVYHIHSGKLSSLLNELFTWFAYWEPSLPLYKVGRDHWNSWKEWVGYCAERKNLEPWILFLNTIAQILKQRFYFN